MNYTIEKYPELIDLFAVRNLDFEKELCFLPENLLEAENTSDFIYSETSTDLRKALKKDNVSIDYLTNDKPLLRSRKNADWFGPIILIGFYTLTNNPYLISVTLNVLSSYLYDFFKGTIGERNVKFEVIVESKKKKEYQKIKYEGPVDGIPELEGIIKALKK
jgi:hypothetical protein